MAWGGGPFHQVMLRNGLAAFNGACNGEVLMAVRVHASVGCGFGPSDNKMIGETIFLWGSAGRECRCYGKS